VNEPVAVPSVEPMTADTLTPRVGEFNACWTPATTGPISVTSSVPLAPNVAPVGAAVSVVVLMFRPNTKGAVWPAASPAPAQSASYVTSPPGGGPVASVTAFAGPVSITSTAPMVASARERARRLLL